jgi:hypothetical protein
MLLTLIALDSERLEQVNALVRTLILVSGT